MWDSKYSDYKITGEDCPFHLPTDMRISAGICLKPSGKRDGIAASIFQGGLAYGQLLGEGVSKRGIYVERTFLCSGGASGGMGTVLWPLPRTRSGAGSKFMESWISCGLTPGGSAPSAGQDIRLGEVIGGNQKVAAGMLSGPHGGRPFMKIILRRSSASGGTAGVPWESCITLGNPSPCLRGYL